MSFFQVLLEREHIGHQNFGPQKFLDKQVNDMSSIHESCMIKTCFS